MARIDPRRHISSRDLPGHKVSDMGPKNLAVSGSEYTDGLSLYYSPAGVGPVFSSITVGAGLIVASTLGNSGSNTQSDNYVTASVLTAGSMYSP